MNIGIFSFFSGSGFLDLGFETTRGYEVLFANEYIQSFAKAYAYSRKKMGLKTPEYGISTKNILELSDDPNHILNLVNTSKQKFDLVGFIGGPPCPDFSIGGKNKGKDGENGKLSSTYISLIKKINPDFFVFENVKGLYRTKKHRDFFEDLKLQLEKSHYTLDEKLINSISYGCPQDRERIILFGIKKNLTKNNICKLNWEKFEKYPASIIKSINWPVENSYSEDSKLEKPLEIPAELTIKHWFEINDVENHSNQINCFVPRAGLVKFQTINEGDSNKKSSKRLHRWRYSPTACYGNNEVHIHPYKPRRITVAEALSIQSMPKNFELPQEMSLTDMFKTIGNGVPFLAGKSIAEMIYDYLNENVNRKFPKS